MLGLGKHNVLDMWEERLGKPYYLYFLEDPRTNRVCYIGLTCQKFSTRLSQHRNPVKHNNTKIAKLQRKLKEEGLTLDGYIVAKGSQNFIAALERWYIYGTFTYLGRDSIKNIEIGGYGTFGQHRISKKKSQETRRRKVESGEIQYKRGEDSSSSVLEEKDVLLIYDMIKDYYSDSEILDAIGNKIKPSALTAIRMGKNWPHVWERECMRYIPSMGIFKGALSSRDKLSILLMIVGGSDNKEIMEKYKIGYTDLNRIREKSLWKQVWNVYDNYYIPKTNNE